MDTTPAPETTLDVSTRRTFSRRSVVRTAAWSAPTIAVMGAAPAFAASGDPTLSVAWRTDSFRATSLANGNSGTPAANGTFAYTAIDMVVAGGSLSKLVVTAASKNTGNGIAVQRLSSAGNRGTTTWATANGDFASWVVGGGTLATANGASAQFATWTFQKVGTVGTSSLLIPWTSVSASDVPIVYTVQGYFNLGAGEQALPAKTVTITDSGATPFWTGSVS